MKQLLITALLFGFAPQEKVTVWVNSVAVDDWAESNPLADSARDLRKKIKGKFWRLAQSEADADVVLTVTDRFAAGTGVVQAFYNPLTGLSAAEEKALQVEVLVTIQANKKQQIFYSGGQAIIWSKAANNVKKRIESYLKHNQERIIELR